MNQTKVSATKTVLYVFLTSEVERARGFSWMTGNPLIFQAPFQRRYERLVRHSLTCSREYIGVFFSVFKNDYTAAVYHSLCLSKQRTVLLLLAYSVTNGLILGVD